MEVQLEYIKQYIRNKRRQKIGTMVAVPGDDNIGVAIGFSKCNIKEDKFDVYIGDVIAIGRAWTWATEIRGTKIPHSCRRPLYDFIRKMEYKGKIVPTWASKFADQFEASMPVLARHDRAVDYATSPAELH